MDNYFYWSHIEMKVKYIGEATNLTKGKIYKVLGTRTDNYTPSLNEYYIRDDDGDIVDIYQCNFEVVDPEEEFEPITAENIRQVLEYNGFTLEEPSSNDGDVYYNKNINLQIEVNKNKNKFWVFEGQQFNDYSAMTNKINFLVSILKCFIDFRLLPKKKKFYPVQFLIDNGFKEINDDEGYTDFELGTFECRLNEDRSEFICAHKTGWHLAIKENLELIVQAAKILEELK